MVLADDCPDASVEEAMDGIGMSRKSVDMPVVGEVLLCFRGRI
jgi:hypothetical protein